jgi:MFS family permease
MKKYGFGWNANLALTGAFLLNFSYSGVFSLVANLYLLRLGYDVAFVGQVNSAAFLAYCLVSFPAGFLVSRWGLRRSMLGGALFMALALAWFPCVELLPVALRKVSLAAGEAAIGVGGAFFMVCVTPCLMETESSRRAAVLSASAMASLISLSLGNLAGGALTALSSRLIGLPQSSPVPYRLGLIGRMRSIHAPDAHLWCGSRGDA